jgi:hypothetical protein
MDIWIENLPNGRHWSATTTPTRSELAMWPVRRINIWIRTMLATLIISVKDDRQMQNGTELFSALFRSDLRFRCSVAQRELCLVSTDSDCQLREHYYGVTEYSTINTSKSLYTMKTYRGRRSILPCFLDLDARRMWVVTGTYVLVRTKDRSRIPSGRCEEDKYINICRKSNRDFLVLQLLF